jgi:hypothetical protein
MKRFSVIAAVVILGAPIASQAQSDNAVSREQVRVELLKLEKAGAGYRPEDVSRYPANLEAATRAAGRSDDRAGYGSTQMDGSSETGYRANEVTVSPYSPSIAEVR